jgi:hypothetical protein
MLVVSASSRRTARAAMADGAEAAVDMVVQFTEELTERGRRMFARSRTRYGCNAIRRICRIPVTLVG